MIAQYTWLALGLFLPAMAASSAETGVKVLVIYYSVTGNTEKLAMAVAEGARRVPGAAVEAKKVADVTVADMTGADAIVMGSPTYFGNIAGPLKMFIDDWHLKHKINLVDKVGGSFSTGADETGGKENVIYSLNLVMLNAGMIIAGPVHERYGMAGVTAHEKVDASALNYARSLGERVAGLARRLKK